MMSLMALVRRRHTRRARLVPEADGEEERVARVREGAEEAQLRANVARGDSLDRGRGWDVR